MKTIKEIVKELKLEALEVQPIKDKVEITSRKKFDWQFKTFNDPTLINMLNIFINHIDLEKQSILTISGPSEIGKTHLLKKSFEYLKTKNLSYLKRKFSYPVLIITSWETIVIESFKNSEYLDKLENCGALLIEDFLSENANNKFTAAAYEIAYKLINRRVGKMTIIDTNKTEDDIKNIDIRIHSRLRREGGEFISVKISTKPFFERK